jgi:DedD protein
MHYQVTFSARQAVLFFTALLGALAGAYFLGIATGISGRPGSATAPAGTEATPGATPTAVSAAAVPARTVRQAAVSPPAVPTAAPEARATAPAVAAREPSSGGSIQFFEEEAPAPTPASALAPNRAAGAQSASGGYWIQVLSTTSESEARARRSRLTSSGYRAAVSPIRGAKGPTLYRVRIGPYSTREEASKVSEALGSKEKIRTWIVSPGG